MHEISQKTRVLLAMSLLKGVGPAGLRKIIQIPFFEEEGITELVLHLPRNAGAGINSNAIEQAVSEADRQIDLAVSSGAKIISAADSQYPSLLNKTKDDPQILFIKGKLFADPENTVAVIGTREPTNHGKIIVERLTNFFVNEGWSIVSGLALGCDALAHKSALVAGGHTIAVLAHGLHTVAPKRHQKLADEIVESGGALVTEYKFGQDPMPTQFVKRDRIQAGLAKGVVMIQSDNIGGSLHASRAAISYDRWLAVPYPTDQDIMRREAKIQANLRLADGSKSEKSDLLKCQDIDLNRLIIIKSKSDYAKMLNPEKIHKVEVEEDLFQGKLSLDKDTANNTDNLILNELLMEIERKIGIYHQDLVKYGLDVNNNPSCKKLIEDFKALEEALWCVRQSDLSISSSS